MLQTIQKIGPVLDLFTTQRPDWGVTEVAEAIGVPRSSAHALLASLVETGLLQCRGRGRYRLGWRIVELNETLRGTVDVRSVAAPVLQRLVELYGETVHLAVLRHTKVLYLDKVPGNRQLTVAGARVGALLDPHCSAVGKVLLAHRSTDELRCLLAGSPLRRLTAATITGATELTDELTRVRAAGMAFDEGEAIPDVSCVAAPVRDDLGAVVASISMTVPTSRFTACRNEYRRAVKAAGQEISQQLAGTGAPRLTVLRDSPGEDPGQLPGSGAADASLRAVSTA
ncbi:MAG TPA: IclR family transcriptional regulator [Pseudonocardia sp.]|jgi:DNA-binding IclR family transcriptional regulator